MVFYTGKTIKNGLFYGVKYKKRGNLSEKLVFKAPPTKM
jgi:hypothetical protein